MKTLFTPFRSWRSFLVYLFLAALLFPASATAQGKKVVIGSGSGYLDYPNAQATLNLKDDDTLVINAGKYFYMNFQNIVASPGHKIYITNNGQVEFSDPSPSTFSNLVNVEIKGNGTAGIDYGFYIHDVIRAISIGGNMSGVYFSYFKLANVIDYAVYMNNTSHVYDGTNNLNSLFYDLKFLHFSGYNLTMSFIQAGGFTRVSEDGFINMTRKIEVAYCQFDYNLTENVINLNKVLDANVHHNRFTRMSVNSAKHTAICFIYGTGDFHHNYISDYWGVGIRFFGFNLETVGAINIYNNVMVNSRKYSAVDIKATDISDMSFSPNMHYCNFKVYNNTIGNLSAADWDCAMVDTYDFLGGKVEIKNNLGFNIQRDKPYDPTYNYIYQRLNVGLPDTSNNKYAPSYTTLGLVDNVTCQLNVNSPAIDKGLDLSALVKDDIDSIPRPQGTAFDIGAHEYKTGIIYPVANAGANRSIQLPLDSAQLDGTASYNPGGGQLHFQWVQLSGPSSGKFSNDTLPAPFVSKLVAGTYQFKVTVSNSQGNSNSATVSVTVAPAAPVYPPVTVAGSDLTITLPTSSVTADGSHSYDPQGAALTYAWSEISGPSAAGITNPSAAVTQVTGLVAGVYQIRLLVSSDKGLSSADTLQVTVNAADAPVAKAGPGTVNVVLPANAVGLDGSASYDPGGSALSYNWAQVSGPGTVSIAGASTATPTVNNLSLGTYQVKLTVTNSSGISASAVENIVVTSSLLSVPVTGKDTTVNFPDGYAILNGTSSYGTNGAQITGYQWQQVSGPAQSTIDDSKAAKTTAKNLQPGAYVFKLTITDSYGQSSIATFKVTVLNTLSYFRSLRMYPNPCTDILHLHVVTDTASAMQFRIVNISGIVVFNEVRRNSQLVFDEDLVVHQLPSGYYILQCIVDNKTVLSGKFIKK